MADVNNRENIQALVGDAYELQWVIGHGGMSTVWLADDHANDREVAIKILRPEFSDNDEFLDRFRNEADAARSIESDNVVATYDYAEVTESNGHTFCFIVMEYIRGESLADLLQREGKLDESLALDVLEQAAHGLSIIHRMGLVHRDIKPGNLLITQNGQVKIADFGIAKAAEAVPLTRTGMVVGTAQYVSPEQAQGHAVTPASDVYSLGVVGYEMLAGKRPFQGDSSVSVALAHINQAPVALSTQISAPARELIGIALRKDAYTRFADGNEFAVAASKVRLGQRPPAPKSAALATVAQEPAPSASTQQLSQVTNARTASPSNARPRTPQPVPAPAGHMGHVQQTAMGQPYTGAGQAAPAPAPAPIQPVHQPKNSGAGAGFGCGMFVAVVIAGIAALALWFMATYSNALDGILDRTPASSTQPSETEPVIVTEWVDPPANRGGSGSGQGSGSGGGQGTGGGSGTGGGQGAGTGQGGGEGNAPQAPNQQPQGAQPGNGGNGGANSGNNGTGAGTGSGAEQDTADATSGTGHRSNGNSQQGFEQGQFGQGQFGQGHGHGQFGQVQPGERQSGQGQSGQRQSGQNHAGQGGQYGQQGNAGANQQSGGSRPVGAAEQETE